jgi:hypothetical protein
VERLGKNIEHYHIRATCLSVKEKCLGLNFVFDLNNSPRFVSLNFNAVGKVFWTKNSQRQLAVFFGRDKQAAHDSRSSKFAGDEICSARPAAKFALFKNKNHLMYRLKAPVRSDWRRSISDMPSESKVFVPASRTL